MSKKILSRQYATKKLKHDYPLGSLMLDYSDIKKAYEDGYDKAVELACQYIKDNLYKYLFVCDGQAGFPTAEFIKYLKSAMEEQV